MTNSKASNPADAELCGVNLLKAARLINLIVGTALSVVCGLNIFNIFGDTGILSSIFNGKFFLNIYLS